MPLFDNVSFHVWFMNETSPINQSTPSQWIWSTPDQPAPANRFTWFRKTFELDAIPTNPLLRFAADSTARLWVNGQLLRRKVTRYDEPFITAENVHAGPWLKKGVNTIVVLHHNWGPITTFMRTANAHAGLWVEADWLISDDSWKWLQADEFQAHNQQILGKTGNTPRIRYPVVCDGRKCVDGILEADFDDSHWSNAYAVTDGPWPEVPGLQETPGQREHPVKPISVLAAGNFSGTFTESITEIANAIKEARLEPTSAAKANWRALLAGKPLTIAGKKDEGHYATLDFALPAHGFPYLQIQQASAGIVIDFAYAEVARTLYAGEALVKDNGWIDPAGVVGSFYTDRYITRTGKQYIELPDERTARWLSVRIYFPEDATLTLAGMGIIKSQYPIEPSGTFLCGDEKIEQIVKLCRIHSEVTMSDAYVDTPGREDGQWIEDIRLRAMIGASWFNDVQLRKLCIRTLAGGEHNGEFHPFFPSNYPFAHGPVDWSVQWVGMVHDQYWWDADKERLKEYVGPMQRFWQWVEERVNNQNLFICCQLLADIRVEPGCRENQSSAIVTAFLIERLKETIYLASEIGQNDWQEELKTLLTRLEQGFLEHHWMESKGMVGTVYGDNLGDEERGLSQAAQINAIRADLITPEIARKVMDVAFPEPDGSPPQNIKRWNNPTFAYSALQALSQVGCVDRAVRHLLERYAPYLPNDPLNPVAENLQGCYGGPLPEYWVSREDLGMKDGDINNAHPDDETGSHGWGAVPLQWLHDTLLGVRLAEPGGGKLTIRPSAAGLPFVCGQTITPKGPVQIYWDPQQWLLKITLPPQVSAILNPPAECIGRQHRWLRQDGKVEANADNWQLSGAGSYEILFW